MRPHNYTIKYMFIQSHFCVFVLDIEVATSTRIGQRVTGTDERGGFPDSPFPAFADGYSLISRILTIQSV